MAAQPALALEDQFANLSHAELASLVIELVEDERVAVPLGEELYRRLNQAAPRDPAPEWVWFQPAQAQSIPVLRRSPH
jgi:hypothetical protein